MKKHGGYVPGIRPGNKTSEYIDTILSRLTFYGGLYLSLVCILPDYLIKYFNIPFYFGGTSLLIVVGSVFGYYATDRVSLGYEKL